MDWGIVFILVILHNNIQEHAISLYIFSIYSLLKVFQAFSNFWWDDFLNFACILITFYCKRKSFNLLHFSNWLIMIFRKYIPNFRKYSIKSIKECVNAELYGDSFQCCLLKILGKWLLIQCCLMGTTILVNVPVKMMWCVNI